MSLPNVKNSLVQPLFKILIFIVFCAVVFFLLVAATNAQETPDIPAVNAPAVPAVDDVAQPQASGAPDDIPDIPGAVVGAVSADTATEISAGESSEDTPIAGAEQNAEEQNSGPYAYQLQNPQNQRNYGGTILRTIIIMALFIGGIYFVLKWISKKQGRVSKADEAIALHAQLPLGPNRFVQVIEVAGRVLLVGTTDQNINLITEITDKDAIHTLRLTARKAENQPMTFTSLLDTMVDKIKTQFTTGRNQKDKNKSLNTIINDNEGAPKRNPSFNIDFLRSQNDRLQKLQR